MTTPPPYASTLLAEIAELTAELAEARRNYKDAHADRLARALERDRTIDEREHLKAELEQLRAELAEVNDRCDQTAAARDRFRRERDAERKARADSATSFAFTIAARGLAEHPWQEYNAHGNTCHYPGCRLTEEEHAEFLGRARGGVVRSDVTADNPGPLGSGCMFSDVARVFVLPDRTEEPK